MSHQRTRRRGLSWAVRYHARRYLLLFGDPSRDPPRSRTVSVFDVLDATRFCGRWSTPLDDPEAWILPGPPVAPRQPVPAPEGDYSWRALARNPRAMLLTGMAAPLIAAQAVRRGVPAR